MKPTYRIFKWLSGGGKEGLATSPGSSEAKNLKKKEATSERERMKIILDPEMELTCKYCGKVGINSNSHSGHMRMCSTRIAQQDTFVGSIRHIIFDEQESLNRWNSWDHSYLQFYDYEPRYSKEALDFVIAELPVFQKFSDNRLQEHALFYLLVLAQVAAEKKTRHKAFDLANELLSDKEVTILQKYWKQIGSRQYEPSAESYFKNWERFIKIKDDVFFNVDFPSWILMLDRYVLSYKMFGWQHHSNNDGREWFMDVMSNNIQDLMFLEQEYVGVPWKRIHWMVPAEVLTLLHSASQVRFIRNNKSYIELDNMPYDPRNADAANYV